jgi:phosphoribosylformimino-5-aminoimidazole carboxamide ribotide isomerase
MEWVKVATAVGASRIILGTEAACDEVVLARLVREVGPERCGLAVDVRDGRVALRTARAGRVPAVVDLANRALDCGVRTIVYRDTGRDGRVIGADVPGAARIADLGAEVIVAGGVAGLDDIRAAAAADLAGVVVGRALYEGRFTLSEALECSQ